MEMKEKVLQSGYYLFDNKPLIFKAWTKDLEMRKADVKTVPVWVQFHQLPLKFWGKSLPKVTGLIGKYIKSDTTTEQRTKLGYARVMIELGVGHKCPAEVMFKDEMGAVIKVGVEYEWKPVTCAKCRGMGHQQDHCRKGEPQKPLKQIKKVWRLVIKAGVETQKLAATEQEVTHTTPIQAKKLVQLHRDTVNEGHKGYNTNTFGALSYMEMLSPHVNDGNRSSKPPTTSNG
ncbi:hypothetical protein vseg_001884 [Gypsophila vaccaria]